MDLSSFQSLLGPGAVTAIMLAVFTLIQKLRENRTTLRTAYETREQARYDQDSKWIAAYRSAAEAHLAYDQEVLLLVGELRYEIQRLRRDQGLTPVEFSPLPKAPPLFPEPQPREAI